MAFINDPADLTPTNGYLLGYDNISFSAITLIFIDDLKFLTQDPGWN